MELDGKQVVITGAGGGLGGAVREAFEAAGATCHAPGHAALELTDEAAVTAWFAARPPLWASIHLAGGFASSPALDTPLAALREQLDLNLTSAFLCSREAARNMRAHGGGGRIVNVTSRVALVPAGGMIAYSISKAAVVMATQALAKELEGAGILVNAVAPSIIDTPANRKSMPKANHGNWPKPEEIAQAILWLASPRNLLTSGAIVPVYGKA